MGDDTTVDETTISDAGGSGSFLGDFAQSALNGLGIGNGADAAQTLGNLLRPVVSPAAAPAPSAVSTSSVSKLVGHVTKTELVVVGLALAVGAYIILRK